MTATRAELHRLLDELPEDEIPAVGALLRAHSPSKWPPAWFGAAEAGRADMSEKVEEILRDELDLVE